MNVTPLAPSPAPTAPAGTESPAAPGDFLAVLAAALGTEQGSAGTGTAGETVPGLPADACPPVLTDEAAEDEADVPPIPEVNPDLAADLATDLAATGTVPVPVVTPTTPATPAVPGAAHRSENGAAHQRADEAPGRLHAAERPSLTRGTEPAVPTGAPTDAAPPAAAPAAPQAAPQATPVPAPSTTGPAPVAAPIAAAPVAATAATPVVAPSAQLDQVTAQVFPEITGMVSRGSGTHRITLTLQPEQLGEVRVVMTIRQGEVHVRLAAGSEARVSLADGSAELVRMLEHVGVTDTKIVVRELPAAATQTAPTFPTAANPDSHPGAGGERNQDQHAGTRADHLATDGAAHPRNHRSSVAAEVRPTQPVTGSRTAGVDLTM